MDINAESSRSQLSIVLGIALNLVRKTGGRLEED
jgi:hypothetical protein